MNAINKWDRRFLDMAMLVAGWSKDPRVGVGAVIVSSEKRVISVGFNGFPRGFNDEQTEMYGKRFVLHAEENAIVFAQRDLKGCTLYVAPWPPCLSCTARIIQNGIKRVVTKYSRRMIANNSHFEDFELSLRTLIGEGVELLRIEE